MLNSAWLFTTGTYWLFWFVGPRGQTSGKAAMHSQALGVSWPVDCELDIFQNMYIEAAFAHQSSSVRHPPSISLVVQGGVDPNGKLLYTRRILECLTANR